jgi:hypothetical protein
MYTKHQKLLSVLLLLSAIIIAPKCATAGENNEPVPVSRPSGEPTLYPGGVWEPGPARYGSTIVDDVAVTMDDGVVLRASIAYPTDLATEARGLPAGSRWWWSIRPM